VRRAHLGRIVQVGGIGLEIFEAFAGRLDAEPRHHDDLNGEQADHQRQHADNAMLREDQRPLYAAWRAERDRQRKSRDQHKKE